MILVLNAFSANMISVNEVDTGAVFRFSRITVEEASAIVKRAAITSAVGHADTAALFSSLLGVTIPANRIDVTFDVTGRNGTWEWAVLGQYKGPRLPEGATTLPDDATIEWYRVELLEIVYTGNKDIY